MNWFRKTQEVSEAQLAKIEEKEKGQEKSSVLDKVNFVLKSSAAYHAVEGYKYAVKIGGSTKTTVVNILKAGDSGSFKGNWLLRFDRPDSGTNFAHINVRHKLTGIKDPHLKLPPGGLTVAKSGGYVCKTLNYLRGLTLVCDVYRLSVAIKDDYHKGTIDNTVKCGLDIALTWTGGLVGATVGGGVGTAVLPNVGTMVGAAAGSVCGVALGRSFGDRLFTAWKGKEKEEPIRTYLPWEYYNVGRANYECILSYFSRLNFNAFC